ncbi:aromatic ring-hydroxylating dioxygenase subunit alpha [Shewanella sp. MMG014]|uniref:aromatic ring-hydroxylating oxygenase subunit alpha n=1 Tax=Shewanella sp. MMG014 TaxID=2822691 RepID=UPI001B37CAC6|nr:aromatic ring-hydroxylating dioxygenase subunit alpha [Shewanella sp. MMG014]MBQ4890385.1 aromatic ring-hydroxylating dioxygenase subunit alpha [Shewanella sp. MMG014]
MNSNNGLPIEAYIDSHFFELEQKHIFSNTWAFAGLIEDVKIPGDYLTVQAGLSNIVIIKNEHGDLLAYHNMCRHRGTQLLEGKGSGLKKLTCPYHDWTYQLSGELVSLPKFRSEFAGIQKDCLNLKPANVGIWRGMIWVHPDPNSTSLQDWFGPIENQLGPHEVESLVEFKDSVVIEDINANWKVIVENYIDHYHLAQLHAGTLNMYNHKKAQFGFVGQHFKFWEPLTDDYQRNLQQNAASPLVYQSGLNNIGVWVPMLFPGIGLAELESSWSVFHITPISPSKSRVIVRTKMKDSGTLDYLKQSLSSAAFWDKKVKPKYASFDQNHPLGSADFMREDIYICEQLQKSFTSPQFEFGPSASFGEAPIRQHQELIWNIIKPYWDSRLVS